MKKKIQNPKLQIPKKFQAPNPNYFSGRLFGVWDLGFLWSLGFGIWSLTEWR